MAFVSAPPPQLAISNFNFITGTGADVGRIVVGVQVRRWRTRRLAGVPLWTKATATEGNRPIRAMPVFSGHPPPDSRGGLSRNSCGTLPAELCG